MMKLAFVPFSKLVAEVTAVSWFASSAFAIASSEL